MTTLNSQEICSPGSNVADELKVAAGCNVDSNATLKDPVAGVVSTILLIGGLLAVVMIIVAGIQMTTSAGNTNAVTKAKQTLLYSVIGLIVMMLAYAIINFVMGTF